MPVLSYQRKRGADAALLAAVTAPSASNPIVTSADQQWEESAGVLQVKAGFGASGVRVAVPSQTFTLDTQAEFGTPGANAEWSTNKWQNNLAIGTNYMEGQTVLGGSGENLSYMIDGNTLTQNGRINTFLEVDMGQSRTVNLFRVWPYAGETQLITVQGKALVGDAYTTLGSANMSGVTSISFTEGAYRYIKVTVAAYLYEVGVFASGYASTNNLIPTDDFVGGGSALSFDPATLDLETLATGGTDVATDCLVEYSTDNAVNWSAQLTPAQFRALPASTLATLSYLHLRFQLTGAQTLGKVVLNTYATAGLLTKAGDMTLSGDIIADDATFDDINMTGNLVRGDGVRTISTVIDGVQTTTDASNTTAYTYAVGLDKTVTMEVEAISMESGSDNRNSYKIRGTFFRNGSGALAQLGDLVSIDTNEAVAGRDCTFVVSSNDVLLRFVGTAATTVYWTYTLKIVLGE